MSDLAFSTLPLLPALLENLTSLGFEQMTPIQAQSLPVTLAGHDLIAQAKTGSGKTAAFSLGFLNSLNTAYFGAQALILCPTRELADQVTKEIRRLARCLPHVKVVTLTGGSPIGPQIGSLEHGGHIIVGTPGRVLDHLNRQTLNVNRVQTLVLDEADRMLDMGFMNDVEDIIRFLPAKRQTLLFSATYPDGIRELSAHIQSKPVEITVAGNHSQSDIEQVAFPVDDDGDKPAALKKLLAHYRPESVVIFCNTKVDCQKVTADLQGSGYEAMALNGDLEQRDRELVLLRFTNRSVPILVATDVAARGLNIKELAAVINYELSHDPEVYVHRIGRTGRAGAKGLALSLVAPAQHARLAHVQAYLEQDIAKGSLETLKGDSAHKIASTMVTFCIEAGRKQKIRPGDIQGALTGGEVGLPAVLIGKIDISDNQTFVAVDKTVADKAFKRLQNGKIKGKSFKVRWVR